MDSPVHIFGIRHHGPGCARSLLQALQALQPDCLLVEGPAEGEALLPMLREPDLKPPVAMLVYMQDQPSRAAFYPFAVFSPEWQALQWAAGQGVPTHFMDLPQTHAMALAQARRERLRQAEQGDDCGVDDDAEADAADAANAGQVDVGADAPPEASADAPVDESADVSPAQEEALDIELWSQRQQPGDPLDWLAQAAGHDDGESWWNHMVEERADSESLFEGIAEAMTALRQELPEGERWGEDADEQQREALREAWMRQSIRDALKAGHQRIAVVCGAWHVPALQAKVTAKADTALLKGLPKAKVQATWAPWTYRNLSRASGYGAGVRSPGWYEHLWQSSLAEGPDTRPESVPEATWRTAGWLARVARLLREKDLDCSSAHIIEATRLAESLAALRGHASPGMNELNEAISTVICMGEHGPLCLIERELIVGDVLGQVPADVPQVPLQRDMEQQQKSLRLKPEAAAKVLALDLRKDTDLARSHFLHRLRLLGIGWGVPASNQQRNQGTFRESWQLQWEPELAVRVIEASVYGATVAHAATARLQQELGADTDLPSLAQAIDDALLANLPELVERLIARVAERAASTGDVAQLLSALPPLAGVYRYGSVRKTDTELLAGVIDELVLRAAIGLPVACMAMDETAAAAMRGHVLAAHDALRLRDAPEPQAAWQAALRSLALGDAGAALLRGVACRLLLDAQALSGDEVGELFSRNLSLGVPPLDAAAWLDGFLNQQALVLLHDEAIWGAVDAWLSQLAQAQFAQILPLVRRSFSAFSRHERQSLGDKVKRSSVRADGTVSAPAPAAGDGASPWDETRAALALPVLSAMLGLNLGAAETDASVDQAEPNTEALKRAKRKSAKQEGA